MQILISSTAIWGQCMGRRHYSQVHSAKPAAMSPRAGVILTVMSSWSIRFVAVVLLAVPAKLFSAEGNCATGGKPARPDCSRAIAFFSEFQTAFRDNDRKKVAGLIEYPLLTSLRGKRVSIRGAAELLSHYDEIFDGGVRCAVLGANAKSVWGNWQGFMIGNGEIWFDGIIPQREKPDPNSPDFWTKYPFKVKTVNNGSATGPCVGK